MQRTILWASAILAFALLGGCNNAKSPGAVNNDVAAAQQKAENKVADAQKNASEDIAKSNAAVDDKSKALNNTEAKATYGVAVAKADGDHDVDLKKCNALSGDAQNKCKDQADADYEAAKANAKANETAQKQ